MAIYSNILNHQGQKVESPEKNKQNKWGPILTDRSSMKLGGKLRRSLMASHEQQKSRKQTQENPAELDIQ